MAKVNGLIEEPRDIEACLALGGKASRETGIALQKAYSALGRDTEIQAAHAFKSCCLDELTTIGYQLRSLAGLTSFGWTLTLTTRQRTIAGSMKLTAPTHDIHADILPFHIFLNKI